LPLTHVLLAIAILLVLFITLTPADGFGLQSFSGKKSPFQTPVDGTDLKTAIGGATIGA